MADARCYGVASPAALHTSRSSESNALTSVLRGGRFSSFFFIWFWQNSLRNVCTIPVAKASRQKARVALRDILLFECNKLQVKKLIGRGCFGEVFLRNFEEQKRSWLMKKLTIARFDVSGSTERPSILN